MSADSIEKIADERALFEQHAPKLHADWFRFDSETNTYVEPICHAQWMGWQFARALPTEQALHGIADEILDLISRCPDELTASVVLANIRRKTCMLRALPSLAELERDAERLAHIAQNYELIEAHGTPGKEKHNLGRLRKIIDAARAKEAKPSDKCSWCGGPTPCDCTDEDCAP